MGLPLHNGLSWSTLHSQSSILALFTTIHRIKKLDDAPNFFRRNNEFGTPKQSILPKLFDRRNLEYADLSQSVLEKRFGVSLPSGVY